MTNTRSAKETYIDALKGIAMLGVILIHCGGNRLPGIWGEIGSLGRNGVQLFLIITGYLNWKSLDKFYINNNRTIKNYFLWIRKKIFKLLPLYYITLIVWTFKGGQSYYIASEGHITICNFIAHLLMIHGLFPHYANSILGVEWYLGSIAIFYIVCPILHKFFPKTRDRLVLLLCSLMFSWLYIKYGCNHLPQIDDYVYRDFICVYSFPAQFPVLILGTLLTDMAENVKASQCKENILWGYCLCILSMIMLIAQVKGKNTIFLITSDQMCAIWFLLLFFSFQYVTIPILNNKIIRMMGEYSYYIYLLHFLIISFLSERSMKIYVGNEILNFVIYYFIIVLISFVLAIIVRKILNYVIGAIRNIKGHSERNLL